MGKRKEDVCPGCSRHCPLDHVRCKYGQKYLEKQQKKDRTEKRRRRWEKYAAEGSPVWTLLDTASRLKRSVRKETISVQQIHLVLSGEEQTQLCALLEKINRILP